MTDNATPLSRATEASWQAEKLRLYMQIIVLRYTVMVYRETVKELAEELARNPKASG